MSAVAKLYQEEDPVAWVSQKVTEITGVQLGLRQRSMVESRLKKRMLDLGLHELHDYANYIKQHQQSEIQELVSLLTTHHTYFFRESAHFQFLENELKNLAERALQRGDKKIRIWSAACSRGQEVYTLAMLVKYHLSHLAPACDFEILGTDVDPQSVEIANNGVFHRNDLKSVPLSYLADHWSKGKGAIEEFVKVKSSLKKHCRFETGNLLNLKASPVTQKFDVIFCRNVFIYFTQEQIRQSAAELVKRLDPKGILFVGISETLNGLALPVRVLGPSIYAHEKNIETLVVQNQNPKAPAKTTQTPLAQDKPLRILCIDDSPSIHSLMKQILKKEYGFEVVGHAMNGIEAEKFLKENKVDAITLDIHMPEMDGIQYLEKNFKSTHPPVVMVSSVQRENADLAMRALKAGASDYVEKPTLSCMQERGEEIRIKLRMAHINRSEKKLELDSAFLRKEKAPDPKNKARFCIFSISDKKNLESFLKAQGKNAPNTFLVIEGSAGGALLEALAKDFQTSTGLGVKEWKAENLPEAGALFLCDTQKLAAALKQCQTQKRSLFIFGSISAPTAECLLSAGPSQLLLEDNKLINKKLEEAADDIVPATSFLYLSDQYFRS